MLNRSELKHAKRWVIKLGSAILTNHGNGLDPQVITGLAKQIDAFKRLGIEVVIVSSGAIAEGRRRLHGLKFQSIDELQAAAAIGQAALVQAYELGFTAYDYCTAQILLTHDDLKDRKRYLNARATLETLLRMHVIPIVNENDTVITEEIKFGDNDSLAALVANLIQADVLVILTDQQGLYDQHPEFAPDAKLISTIDTKDPRLKILANQASKRGGSLGRGGMYTKIKAAQTAAHSGTTTIIAHGHEPMILHKLYQGEHLGTLFQVKQSPLAARKQWLAAHLQEKGSLVVNQCAKEALQSKGVSLLAVGVIDVHGHFERGDLVRCVDSQGETIAKGLIHYNYDETLKIKGLNSKDIVNALGYVAESELIHRNNMVVF